jgi:hypothetical protein
LAWLTAAAAAARQLREPVLGFLSDDDLLDFAAVVTRGVIVIGDRLGQYLSMGRRGPGDSAVLQAGHRPEPPVPPGLC